SSAGWPAAPRAGRFPRSAARRRPPCRTAPSPPSRSAVRPRPPAPSRAPSQRRGSDMSRAFVVREHGGPEALRLEELEVPAPGPGQLRIRNHAIGLNFIDVYQRTGLYATPLPFVAGNEGAGE